MTVFSRPITLARISHHPSRQLLHALLYLLHPCSRTTDADLLAVTGRTPSSRFDVVSTTPAPSSGPCTPSQRHLDALATNGGEKCGLAPPGPGLRAALLVLLLAVLIGCSADSDPKEKRVGRVHLVELVTVTQHTLQYTADRAGSLRAVREVKLFNQEEGRVVAVAVHQSDSVKRGQALVHLDDRLLQAQLDKAVAARKQADLDVERLQQLAPKKLVSENTVAVAGTKLDIARADESVLRTRLSYMTIAAPFDGKIAERLVEPGDVAPKHTHLLTVVDPSQLVTDVLVSELLLPRLRRGDRADVRIDALGDTVYSGKILRIYPTVDPATRQGRIEVVLKPVPKGARAGQFCRVTLYSRGSRPLVVPFAALRRDEQGEFVFVTDENNKVRRTPVRSGLRLAGKVEIHEGLQPGQQVVVKGFLGLVDGQVVKSVNGKPLQKTPPAASQENA